MKYLAIISFLLIVNTVTGQLFPVSDFYVLNSLVINPACAGSQDALSTTFQHRNQWVGFNDAPKSSMLSAHAPFFNDQMGLGLLLNRHTFGIYRETSIMGNYAYRLNLHNGKLSMGIAFGVTSYKIAWNDLQASDPDDELLTDNSVNNTVPDFSVGSYYETNRYFIGFSIPFFLSHESDDNSGKLVTRNKTDAYNYFLTGGYSISVNSFLNLKPSVVLIYNKYSSLQGDIHFQAELWERLRAGAGYRTSGVFIGVIGINVNRQLRVSYSFDSDSGKAGNYRRGSHEIMVGYLFRYARNVISPLDI